MFITGNDDDFSTNGMMFNHFSNPNVYDTGCQVSVMCSRTTKYIPFCQQVLNQGGDDPIEKFRELREDYK